MDEPRGNGDITNQPMVSAVTCLFKSNNELGMVFTFLTFGVTTCLIEALNIQREKTIGSQDF